MIPDSSAENVESRIEDFLQARFATATHFNTTIHPSDQMFTHVASVRGNPEVAHSEYFTSGARIMNIVRQLVAWQFGGLDQVTAFLDFASGFGRLTRFLVQELSPDRIWVSDIQADAVSFQEEQFGVHGIVSATDPDAFSCAEKFDCVFVASLFSHLPEATFVPWLGKLYRLLQPEGLLIFTVHDEARLNPASPMSETGLCFFEASEIATLDTKDYGVSFVTEAFVRDAVARATGDQASYFRIKDGLSYHQDIYLVVNGTTPDFSRLQFNYGPGGTLEYCRWIGPDLLAVGGWAKDITPGSAVKEIQVFVNGRLRQTCLPFMQRPDLQRHFNDAGFLYAGWECSCHVPGGTDTDFLLAKVISTADTENLEYLLYVGSIGGALLPSPPGATADQRAIAGLNAELESIHHYVRELGSELDKRLRYIRTLESTLARKNAALLELEKRVRRLEAAVIAARRPWLPWKRRPRRR